MSFRLLLCQWTQDQRANAVQSEWRKSEWRKQKIEKNRFAILTFDLYFEKDKFATLGAQRGTCAYEVMEGTSSRC